MLQAALLGVAATISHTAIVWIIALGGMYFGQQWTAETSEPYLQIASAILIIVVALWMVWRTWRLQKLATADQGHSHQHDESKVIDTGHGAVRLDIFEDGVPPRFRLFRDSQHDHQWSVYQVKIETERADGTRQIFSFVQRDGFMESEQNIPEPHEFIARLSLGHGHHRHDYDVEYVEHNHHHAIKDYEGSDVSAPGYQYDTNWLMRTIFATDLANTEVTTTQIIIFGLTGGLIPCPASITVLLLCLQVKKIALGAMLVLCFSIGLALTMVAAGVLAALSVKHVSKRWSGFSVFAQRAPYFSGSLMLLVGIYLGYHGLHALV